MVESGREWPGVAGSGRQKYQKISLLTNVSAFWLVFDLWPGVAGSGRENYQKLPPNFWKKTKIRPEWPGAAGKIVQKIKTGAVGQGIHS